MNPEFQKMDTQDKLLEVSLEFSSDQTGEGVKAVMERELNGSFWLWLISGY